MIWQTQQVQRERQETSTKQNTESDSGIIEEIECINFMCHEHLTVPLGPLINFIIGHNGSGKSAVLTALTICLGGKATATNRAQNLKSLIKEGKDHCTVSVRIKNTGALAYKHDQYGDSIYVERHFNRSGTSGFKLKDQNRKLVSNKKGELEDILDAFSMQIDNPMNVLTQDMARQFLNHSTPKDKYKFFLQGTQLENLNRDYQQIEQSLEVMNARAEVKKADIGILRKRMEDLAGKARRAENLEVMRAQERKVANQVVWSVVEEAEAEMAEDDAELGRIDAVIRKREALVEKASADYDRSDRAHEVAKENVFTITVEMEPAQQAVQDAKVKFDEAKQKMINLKADERKAGSDVTAKGNEVKKIEHDIEQLRRRQAEADNGLYAEKARELEEAKEHQTAAKEAFMEHASELPSIKDALKAAHGEKIAADQRVSKARDEEGLVRSRIKRLQEGERNWMEAYDNQGNLQQLMRAIESERGFREHPVGPMGRHVKLLKPDWGYVLEKQFGANLNAFVVTSKQDQSLLGIIMRRCRWIAPIFIGKPTRIDTSHHEPDSTLLTWMRALKIDNDLVRNQLIINQSIDQTVLKESRADASQFMHSRGPLTRNVKMCFTFTDGDKRKGRTFNYTPSGAVNDSPIAQYNGNFRMQADKEDQIRTEQARLDGVRRDVQQVERSTSDVQEQLNRCKAQEQDHVRRHKQLNIAYQRAQEAVDRLDGELNDATPDAAAIEVLEEQLSEARKELEHAEGVYEDIHVQFTARSTESKGHRDSLQAVQGELEELQHRLNKAQSTVRSYQGKREDDLKSKNNAITQVEAAQQNRQLWEKKRDESKVAVDEAMETAQGSCPQRVDVPPGKTPQELGNLLKRLENTRQQTEKELGGSQEELLRAANEAKRTHQEARREFDDIESVKSHLINTLNHRRTRWQQFRSGISVRARVTFNYLLSERKFRGTLNIDHKKGLLDIHVSRILYSIGTCTNLLRFNRTARTAVVMAGKRRLFLVVKSHTRPSVCCSHYGMPWARQSGV